LSSTKIPNKSARIYKFTFKNLLKLKLSCSKIVLACNLVPSVFLIKFWSKYFEEPELLTPWNVVLVQLLVKSSKVNPRNRPWRTIRLWDVKDPTLSR
jgi:hypothetical protein